MTDPVWAHRADRAMGSTADVLVWARDAEALVTWAHEELARLEACWSRFRDDSELSALNAQAGRGPVRVSPTLWAALDAARDAHARTGGLFDPTILPNLRALGYEHSFPFVRAPEPRAVPGPPPGFGVVGFDDDEHVVVLPARVALDLGGIGKGLAADLVVDGLLARGATSACVGMGGDVRVGGPGPDADQAWEIPVEDPRDDRRAFTFPLVDEALAQSSVLFRRWEVGGEVRHHLLDPRTGRPSASDVVAAVTTAPEAWLAECVAKAALLAGVRGGLDLLARTGVDGWLLAVDGTAHATPLVADIGWETAQPAPGDREVPS